MSKAQRPTARHPRHSSLGVLFGAGASLAILVAGCGRQHYRQAADEQAYGLLSEKQTDPRWRLPENYSVYTDSRSRYYDPYDPDHEPMPPDDPASHELMHCVYGKRGYARWHQNGDTESLENPEWQQHLDTLMDRDEDRFYRMELDDALQLALLHSPNYQRNFETLYLAALDVSIERFRFDVQFYGGSSRTLTASGNERAGNAGESSTTVTQQTFLGRGRTRTAGAQAGMQKLFPTGGQLLVDFANTFVWQFAGPDRNTVAQSLLSFSFVQPLLRAGGREVQMERLTIAERALLAAVRQMERYRQGFFGDVAMGTGSTGSPSRRGGFAGGTGLSGFTGTGTGGFGGVGEGQNFGRGGGVGGGGGGAGGAGGAGFAAGVAGNVGGFTGLVQQTQQIRNREANLAAQLDNLGRIEALQSAGRIDSLQVDQFRQNVQAARSQYLDSINSYDRALETFLTGTLGLPPHLAVRIDESLAAPFQFIDPKITQLQSRMKLQLDGVRADEQAPLASTEKAAGELDQFRKQIGERLQSLRNDFTQLESVRSQRLSLLTRPAELQEFNDQLRRLTDSFELLEKRFASAEDAGNKLRDMLKPDQARAAREELVRQAEALSDLLLELSLVQAGTRLETILVKPVRLKSSEAMRIAQANRLDLMNQRADVVDQWRLIAFNADALQSDLDLVFSGDMGTLNRNPAKFRDETGQLSVGLRFDAPFTRLQERNNYRQALIDYQRVRREYVQFEDTVHQSLRQTLRRLEQFEQEMELRRAAMRIAIRTVDLTQETLRQPPRAGAAGAAPAGLGPTAVRDLLGALSDLLQTQNDVMNTYLNYQALRMLLYRDVGIIRFDDRGRWIDEPLEDALHALPQGEQNPLPPPVPPAEPQPTARPEVTAVPATIEADPELTAPPAGETVLAVPPEWRPTQRR